MTDVFRSIDAAPRVPDDLRHSSLYINRELSWLEFNRRVLREAQDPRTPLLERIKFLGIFSSNLDEFFQVRVSGLKQQQAVGFVERTADGLTPDEQLRAVAMVVRSLQAEHCRTLRTEVLPALAADGVRIYLNDSDLGAEDRDHLTRYFAEQVYPVLTPLAVDPAHPFPYISNLTVSLAVVLRGEDGEERFARVKVPAILPRWVPLPGAHRRLPLEVVVAMHLESLFPGQEVLGCHPFRITRNTDLDLDDDEAEDLLALIAEEVRNRRFGEVVRIEVHPTMPTSLRDLLLEEFNTEQEAEGAILTREDVYEVVGLLNAAGLLELTAPDRPHLHDPTFVPVVPPRFATGRDLFEVIREGDVLVHHPYESFPATVERFVQAATEDPDVLAIKITLYRIGTESGIARRLVEAAERGKQVAVLIELQARFDEESNIRWATRLQDAGAHVSYGVAGLKTHAKTILVVRREGEGIRRYVHIGTGNYSARNARTYTDFGLFSAREELGADLTDLFNVLTGFATREQYRRIVVAPAGIRPWLLDRIRREADHAKAGRPARILAKINALVDQEIILALYEASNAGVQVDLLVRGICCLRPGIAGASERIRVVSVIGRFLEHSRAWWFRNGDQEEVLISSADWMPRNLDRRIEVAVPLEEPAHRTLVRGLMEVCLEDNRQAWDLLPNGNYRQRHPGHQPERATHAWLLERYAARTGDRLVLEP
jgi:polyphosphate kinase